MDAVECLLRQAWTSSSTTFDISAPPRSALERSYAISTGRLSQTEAAKGLSHIYPLVKAVQDVGAIVLGGLGTSEDHVASMVSHNLLRWMDSV